MKREEIRMDEEKTNENQEKNFNYIVFDRNCVCKCVFTMSIQMFDRIFRLYLTLSVFPLSLIFVYV